MFKDEESGQYAAKVTDFGYSTRIRDESDRIQLPKSWPWGAPEHGQFAVRPSEARKMDVFSFGMTCLWLLFEERLSVYNLPETAGRNATWSENLSEYKTRSVLEFLRRNGQAIIIAEGFVDDSTCWEDKEKETIKKLFRGSLSTDPSLREDMKGLLDCLQSDR